MDPEKTLDAVWVTDSETGRRYLMDRRTNQIIGEWLKNETSTDQEVEDR